MLTHFRTNAHVKKNWHHFFPHFFSLGYPVPKSWQLLCYVSHWCFALNRCSIDAQQKAVARLLLAVGMKGREEALFFLLTLWTIWYFKNEESCNRQHWLPVTHFPPTSLLLVSLSLHGPLHGGLKPFNVAVREGMGSDQFKPLSACLSSRPTGSIRPKLTHLNVFSVLIDVDKIMPTDTGSHLVTDKGTSQGQSCHWAWQGWEIVWVFDALRSPPTVCTAGPFIPLFYKYWLNNCSVSSTVLHAGDTAVNQNRQKSLPHGASIPGREWWQMIKITVIHK